MSRNPARSGANVREPPPNASDGRERRPETANTVQRRVLPDIAKFCMWHNISGLVVSPLNRTLPANTAPSDSRLVEDYMKPRSLDDGHIWYAFYPRKPIHSGPLFSVLAYSPRSLTANIHSVSSNGSKTYFLDRRIQDQWKVLEDGLIAVAQDLLSNIQHRHVGAIIPDLSYPPIPQEFGYMLSHSTREEALHYAHSALLAFRMLSAFTSFAFALWLEQDAESCLDAAFELLSANSNSHDLYPRLWLQYLRESIVCEFSPGLRPGGFIDPYTTKYGGWLLYFCRASVPIWMTWGHDYERRAHPAGLAMVYLPPREQIVQAQAKPAIFADIVLPSEESYAFGGQAPLPSGVTVDQSHSGVNAIDRSAIVSRESRQRPHESWTEFRARMEESLETRKKTENAKERQKRLSLEKAAEKKYTRASRVFVWEEDEVLPDFYRRTHVTHTEVDFYWEDSTEHQRFFWSHYNEWDICPQVPAYPPGVAQPPPQQPYAFLTEIDYLDRETFPTASFSSAPPSAMPLGVRMLETLRVATADPVGSAMPNALPVNPFVVQSLRHYVTFRHGYNVNFEEEWNPGLHKNLVPRGAFAKAVIYMLHTEHQPGLTEGSRRSVVDFINTASNTNLDFRVLPAAWDIGDRAAHPVRVDGTFRTRRAVPVHGEGTLYVIGPGKGSDPCKWFITTTSATAVLLVYRSPWTTMYEAGRGLLELGIPFRTVVEVVDRPKDRPAAWFHRSIGLGRQPAVFRPTVDDYVGYKRARELLLQSWRGRVFRLMGGIVGRIAAEIVPDIEVLDGPLRGNEVVGTIDNISLVDDGVNEEELDFVSGVYHIGDIDLTSSHSSWYPKQYTWTVCGFAGDQWSPLAEEWYLERKAQLENGEFNLISASNWKAKLKRHKARTAHFLDGSERLAREFLRLSDRGLRSETR